MKTDTLHEIGHTTETTWDQWADQDTEQTGTGIQTQGEETRPRTRSHNRLDRYTTLTNDLAHTELEQERQSHRNRTDTQGGGQQTLYETGLRNVPSAHPGEPQPDYTNWTW